MTEKAEPPSTLRKLWRILTHEQHRAGALLIGLMLIGTILETLGIGLIVPAIALMTKVDLGTKYPVIAPLLRALHNPSREQLIVGGVVILVAVSAMKAVFVALLTWSQARFVFGVQVDLAQRLFAGYMRQPYTFHLQRNSAELIAAITSETNIVTQNGLTSALILLTETQVLLAISALLVVVEPVGALVVAFALGLAIWGFGRLTREHVLDWGRERQRHDVLRLQHLHQGFGSVKDVIVLGRESEFLGQHLKHSTGSARSGARQFAMQQMPRLWLELLAVSGLAGLVLVMIWQGKPVDALLPTLGLFAAATFRLMPSVNRVMGAIQNMRYSRPAINTLYAELRLVEKVRPAPVGRPASLPFVKELVLDQVSFAYPSGESLALHAVSLSVPSGASVGIIGGSGAGKSTLVDIILGVLTPMSGTVCVDGVDIQTSLRAWQDKIGYVPQFIFLTDDTLRANVAFGIPTEQIDELAVQRAVRAAQLEDFVVGLPEGLDTSVGERGVRLSGGQRQRIGIARALYHNPPVLVLDEATSSLDTATEHEVMEAVRNLKKGKTIIIVAHRLSTVEHCEYTFRLDQGELAENGSTTTVLGKDL